MKMKKKREMSPEQEAKDSMDVAYLSFSQQQEAASDGEGWLQGRYYSDGGTSVREHLAFEEVFGICPFEVGVNRAADRKAFKARFAKVVRLLELQDLLPRPFVTLSNGEMRRVLFARALLKGPKKLILDDPMAGLDPERRERFKKIVSLLSRDGIDVVLRVRNRDELPVSFGGKGKNVDTGARATASRRRVARQTAEDAPPVIELKNIRIRFGKRWLFRDFNWTVRRGEHWVLKGHNGSGKTTLFALITGDSPLGYANDVTVLGQKRKPGQELRKIRRRIGMVSPEMQTYLCKSPVDLVEEALASKPDLLLLDEPCMNLNAPEAKRLLRRISTWLDAHPQTTAICIAHRADHVPPGFEHEMELK